MAKNTPAYQITDKSPVSYNGKVAFSGDVVTDLPGESITWLLADGFIVAVDAPAPDEAPVEPAPENPAPAEPEAA